jgi:hypothetical protein
MKPAYMAVGGFLLFFLVVGIMPFGFGQLVMANLIAALLSLSMLLVVATVVFSVIRICRMAPENRDKVIEGISAFFDE